MMPTPRAFFLAAWPWWAGIVALELACASGSGLGIATIAAPQAGIWPRSELFYGAVDTLDRNPSLAIAAGLAAALPGLALALTWPAAAGGLVVRLGGHDARAWPRTLLPFYAQALWHAALYLAAIAALGSTFGAAPSWSIAGLLLALVHAVSKVARDFSWCAVALRPASPWHPRHAIAGFRDAVGRAGIAALAVTLVAAQGLLAGAILVVSAWGLEEGGTRWLVRGMGSLAPWLGLWRLALVHAAATAPRLAESAPAKTPSLPIPASSRVD